MTDRAYQAKVVCEFLMDEYGLTDQGWKFKWNKRNTAMGVCNYRKKQIELSIR